MNIFKALTGGGGPVSANGVPREQLPELNAFVDVAVGDNRQRQSIPIDAIADDTFSTRALPALRVGGSADFLYANSTGRFRFTAVCVGIDERQAHFKMPDAVKTISTFGSKRSAVRLDSLLPIHWRYAPGGQGNGEFVKGSMSDLSRGGASLVVGRELKPGTNVELRFTLKTSPVPLVVLGEVVRAAKIETSTKNSAGVRFLNVEIAGERVIDDFILQLQTMRRERGVV